MQRRLSLGGLAVAGSRITKKGTYKTSLNRIISQEARSRGVSPHQVRDILSQTANSDSVSSAFSTRREAVLAATAAAAIRGRVKNYQKMIREGDFERDSGAAQGGGRYVDDEYQQAEEGIHTHFSNTYSAERAIMRENYLNRGTVGNQFFASDVFFSQWQAAMGTDDIPLHPPRTIVRDTIDNQQTRDVLKAIVLEEPAEAHIMPGTQEFRDIIGTPNGKTTNNIVNDYTVLNRIRGGPAIRIDRITVTKASTNNRETGWKIIFRLAW